MGDGYNTPDTTVKDRWSLVRVSYEIKACPFDVQITDFRF